MLHHDLMAAAGDEKHLALIRAHSVMQLLILMSCLHTSEWSAENAVCTYDTYDHSYDSETKS